ncbi:PRC-barrel domain-containing protein [Caenispirillum salinarum]|uniref:PRC-barrel domain-containing protein n=1 Tax=Caenispirillum salinarum TaxID=859058 RepID=UPI00384F5B25
MRTPFRRTIALAVPLIAFAGLVEAAEAPKDTKPNESWMGQSAAEQAQEPTAGPRADTVQNPVPKAEQAATAPRSGSGAPGVTAEEVEEVNAATDRFVDRMIAAQGGGSARLGDLVGRPVHTADGEAVGDLDDVVGDADGNPRLSLALKGDWVPPGRNRLIVPADDISVDADGRVVVPYSRPELAEMAGD